MRKLGDTFSNLVRHILMVEKQRSIREVALAMRMDYANLHARISGRTRFKPEEISRFCAGKKGVLVLEEGQPEFIEQEIATILRRADVAGKLHGKDCMHMAGDYNVEALVRGLTKFLAQHAPHIDTSRGASWLKAAQAAKQKASALLDTSAASAARPSAVAAAHRGNSTSSISSRRRSRSLAANPGDLVRMAAMYPSASARQPPAGSLRM